MITIDRIAGELIRTQIFYHDRLWRMRVGWGDTPPLSREELHDLMREACEYDAKLCEELISRWAIEGGAG